MCRGRSGGSRSGKAEAWCSGETETAKPLFPHYTQHLVRIQKASKGEKKIILSNRMNGSVSDYSAPFVLLRITKTRKRASVCLCVLRRGVPGLLPPLVCILYRVAPSLYSPILAVARRCFQHRYAMHRRHPVDGGQSHSSLSVSEFSSLRRTGGSQLPLQPQAERRPPPEPPHPTPRSSTLPPFLTHLPSETHLCVCGTLSLILDGQSDHTFTMFLFF